MGPKDFCITTPQITNNPINTTETAENQPHPRNDWL